MSPQLICISGSLKGTTFALTEDEVSIGREPSNYICPTDISVSRRHCLIRRAGEPEARSQSPVNEEGDFKIIDLDTLNGTFVNSVPIREHRLVHGDQIVLGTVQFVFLLDSEVEPASMLVNEVDLVTRSTIRLQREDALYLRPDKVLVELPKTMRVARDLNALLKITTTINAIRGLRELQERLLELIREVVPAERQAILLTGASQANFSSVCGWSKQTGPDNSVAVSRTIATQVLRERIALLSNDLVDDTSFKDAASLVNVRVCSVLCAPLIVFEKVLGVIYLDSSDPSARFDENDLQLVTALAAIAAIALENVSQYESLENENAQLQDAIRITHQMIGEGAGMRTVYDFIRKVAPTDANVLIRGESGTGKELVANAIHLNSPRTSKPFIAINCATLTETLLESELFGHEKGAFTGAIAQKRGKLEIANGGTVFLDELGELAPTLQAKLLRVLQTLEFERVGGTQLIKVDVRIITATNRDLEQAVQLREFRQDLYYRLNVVALIMPALRDRPEDIPLLASYFLAKYSKKCKRKVTGLSWEARRILCDYDWPGNVRELENAIERAVVLGSTSSILPDDLPEALLESTTSRKASPFTYYDAVREAKKQSIIKAMAKADGNYTEAAKLLAIHPNNLHRLIRSLNLRAELARYSNRIRSDT
jgi:Nif-specific regulatory protein